MIYAIAVATSFLLFPFCLQWHPWRSRLHQGVFVAAAPLVAVVLTRPRRERFASITAGALLVLGLPWLLLCQERPVLGQENLFNTPRDRLFFKTPHQEFEAPFMAARDFLATRDLSQVGLMTTNSSWEYMLWVLLQRDHTSVRIEHVNMQDASARLMARPGFREFSPDVVITLDQRPQPGQLTVGGASYTRC